jgi:putative effector of murein hydrolase
MPEFLSGSAYWALLLTVAAYQFGIWLNRKTKSALFHPIVVVTVIIIPIVIIVMGSTVVVFAVAGIVTQLLTGKEKDHA